jgi:hypothetical protein
VTGNLVRIAITLIVVAGLASAAQFFINDQSESASQHEMRRLKVTVDFSNGAKSASCDTMFPLSLTVVNQTPKTLMSMDINLSARMAGTSTDILRYEEKSIKWDSIVPPDHVMTLCYAMRQLPPGSVISAGPSAYTVDLRETEPWMLTETKAFKLESGNSKR